MSEMNKETMEGMLDVGEEAAKKTEGFFKKAFHDMAESARAQHEVDKANFAAVKAESKAQWEEAKMSPKAMQEKLQADREKQLAEINERIAAANARIEKARK